VKPIERVGMLGFGEVGQVLSAELGGRPGLEISAFDIQFAAPSSEPSAALASHPAVRRMESASDLARCSELIISAVTASEDIAALESLLSSIAQNTYVLDVNSVSPQTKRTAYELVEAAGGRYVEAAIMSAIEPKRTASPMLLGGSHAADLLPALQRLGFSQASICSEEIGPASATKMCRSIIIKGLEAMMTEAALSARHYGVESAVLDSLSNLLPAADWGAIAEYMMSRSIRHGKRRAEEMHEVAKTVRDAGVEPWMSLATAERQAWAAQFSEVLSYSSFAEVLDGVRALNRNNAGGD